MAAFFQNKVKDVNEKIENSEKTVGNLDSYLKQLEGSMNTEMAKMRK
jgi:hypothetical protein